MLNEMFADLIGVKWEDNGRDPKKGLDCYGLVMETARRMSLLAPDCNDPSFNKLIWEKNKDICEGFTRYGFKMSEDAEADKEEVYTLIEKPEPGCMVLFRLLYPYTTHIGVVLDDCDHFIHAASEKKGVCIEKISSISWRHRITGFYKWTKKLQ